MSTDRVRPVAEGDVVFLSKRENFQQRFTVKKSCGGSKGFWACATHKQTFANNLEKDCHITDGKEHTLVWVCYEHGPEVP